MARSREFAAIAVESPDDTRRISAPATRSSTGLPTIAHRRSRPVMARTEPGDVRKQLPPHPPADPEPFDAIVGDLDRIIVPGLSHWQHPQFFGYFPCNGTLASVLGDYVSTGLGVLGPGLAVEPGAHRTRGSRHRLDARNARAVGRVERRHPGHRVDEHADRADLRARADHRLRLEPRRPAGGAAAARRLHLGAQPQLGRQGGAARRLRPRQRPHRRARRALRDAARRAGRGDRRGPSRRRERRARSSPPSGSTASTALDPIDAIATLAAQHGLWLHVDAAMAGSAMVLPECRWMWNGVEGADSLVVNPHKWLGAAFDCTLYYVRDPEHLVRVMSTNPSFLQSAADGRVKNLRDWGIPLGRRFRALKLWFLIREQGVVRAAGAAAPRSRQRALARRRRSPRRPEWRVLAPVPLQTLCVRHEPPGVAGDALDRHTQAWCDRVNRSGAAYLTPAVLDGRWMVRVSIGAEQTERIARRGALEHDANGGRTMTTVKADSYASVAARERHVPRGLANTHADLRRSRRRHPRLGRRRQGVPRLHQRHRRPQHRPSPPARRRAPCRISSTA